MLTRVTITGADDHTPISSMLELSAEYPWLEWGILVSQSREGRARYPGWSWCNSLERAANNSAINISMHVCGEWARQIFNGEQRFNWFELPPVRNAARRIQLNGTPGEFYRTAIDLIGCYQEYIFQLPRAAAFVINAALAGFSVAGLFDQSGGEGIEPIDTAAPIGNIPCGYAGGIGPDNVVERVEKISAVCGNRAFWIDMESRVRTHDCLDLDKVRSVLDRVQPYVYA